MMTSLEERLSAEIVTLKDQLATEKRRHLRLQEAVRIRKCHEDWPVLLSLIQDAVAAKAGG